MRTRILIPVVMAAALGVGLFLNRPAHAILPDFPVPQESFDVAVPPGRTLSTELTISSTIRSLVPLRIEVSPTLAPYVASIEPQVLPVPPPPSFAAGSTTLIQVVFTVATGTPSGVVNGNLLAGGKPLLPMKLTIGELLYPSDPGEAGKETLEGIDADGDGIRDDIERYIEMSYPSEPDVRAGLRQYAAPLQQALLHGDTKESAHAVMGQIDRAASCLVFHSADIDASIKEENQLLAAYLNTDERSRAYIRYDRELGGILQGRPLPAETTCDSLSGGGVQ